MKFFNLIIFCGFLFSASFSSLYGMHSDEQTINENLEEDGLILENNLSVELVSPSYYYNYEFSTVEVELSWKIVNLSSENFSQTLNYSINNAPYQIELPVDIDFEYDEEDNSYLYKYSITDLKQGSRIKWNISFIDENESEILSETFLFYIEKSNKLIYISADGTGAGSSWSDASSLRDALTNYTYGDVLWLKKGIYTPTTSTDRNRRFELEEGISIYGGFGGFETELSERNWKKNKTVLSGNIGNVASSEDNSYNILYLRGLHSPITSATLIDGVIVEDGSANKASDNSGAGLKLFNASPVFVNVHFRNNYSLYNGGAAQCDIKSDAKFYNCLFDNNEAGRKGGAFLTDGSVSFINCVFYGNKAGERGGAMCGPSMPNEIEIFNSILLNNTAPTGDQIFGQFNILYSIIEGHEQVGRIYNNNPGFVDAELGDYRLMQGSFAINRGNNNYVPSWLEKDFNDNSRILGGYVDLGIYEGAVQVPKLTYPENLSIFDYQTESVDLQWNWKIDNKFGSYTLEYKINNESSILEEKILENYFDFADISPESDVSWRIGVKLNDEEMMLWSAWNRFIIGRDKPIYVKNNATGSGSSWNDATTLQQAMEMALFGDEIWVAAGVYRPTSDTDRSKSFTLADGIKLYGGFAGTENNLSQRNFLRNPTIFSGNIGPSSNEKDNSYNVFRIEGTAQNPITSETVVDGIYIQDGYATLNMGQHNSGAGMYFAYASPTIRNVCFRYNYASRDGGAVYVGINSAPYFGNIIFMENEAASHGGAAFIIENSNFYNSVFYNNRSQYGGAISTEGKNTFAYNSIFLNNIGEVEANNLDRAKAQFCLVDNGEGTENIITDNPLFKDIFLNDFSFEDNSPAINAGNNDFVPSWLTTDYYGNERIIGDAVDIGVFEHPDGPVSSNIESLYNEVFSKVEFWPNPYLNNTELYIRFGSHLNNAKVQLISLNGLVIKEWHNIDGGKIHSLGSFNILQGVYLLSVYLPDGQIITEKLVVDN